MIYFLYPMYLTKHELKSTLVVSGIFSLRLLGLFVLLPIFSIYASEYNNSSSFLAGIAIGSYSLSQAIMQVPMGYLSDKFGRKKIVLFGLALFVVGSAICFYAIDITILIIGRIIQGLGAISSVGIATLSENTSEERRASAFTIMGISVGFAFVVGFIAGPFISTLYSFKSLFLLLLVLGVIAIIITILYYPIDKNTKNQDFSLKLSYNHSLLQVYMGSFFLSLILSIMLYIYPLTWKNLGANPDELFLIYLKIFLPSVILIYPSVRFFEKIKKIGLVIYSGWAFLIIGFLFYIIFSQNVISLYVLGILFFFGVSVFNSILPSLLSFNVSSKLRATGNGPFYIMNFLGHAVGAILAGTIYMKSEYFGLDKNMILSIFSLAIVILWIRVGLPKYEAKS